MNRRLIAYDIITKRTAEEMDRLGEQYVASGWQPHGPIKPHGPIRIRTHSDPVTGEETKAYWRVVARYGKRTA
jgi:hypothetical protein